MTPLVTSLFSPAVYRCVLPRPRVATVDWARANLIMPSDSKIRGGFRLDLFPHLTDLFNVFDDDHTELITWQTAAQVGKTTYGQACLAKTAAVDPHPMMFADADQRSTERVIRRTWRLFSRCDALAPVLPPPRLQAKDKMECQTFVVHGAWAGSAASAADFGAYIIVLNEVDKMRQRSTDTEADFRYLCRERAKGYVGHKILQISTPSTVGASFIESERLKGDNRRRLVPCPHCGHGLELNRRVVKFDKLSDDRIDAALARQTAWIQCPDCKGRIEEEHRYEMCNAGFWVPEGCELKDGQITGTPARSGRHASFGPLSTLHSLLPGVSIGSYAENWAEALTTKTKRREAIRHHVNSWDGETWDPQPVRITTPLIIKRCGIELAPQEIPDWTAFLTRGVDVGRVGDVLLWYWVVMAWGASERSHLVDFGLCMDTPSFLHLVRTQQFVLNGHPLRPLRTLVDSSAYANEVYNVINPLRSLNVWPIKGESVDPRRPYEKVSGSDMWFPGMQRSGIPPMLLKIKIELGDYDLIKPNTYRSQDWIQSRIDGLIKRDDAGWMSIPVDMLQGEYVPEHDLGRHLQGDYQDAETGLWLKRYEDQDFRSCVRYALAGAFHYCKNWSTLRPFQAPPRRSSGPKRDRKPSSSGASFVASQR